MRFSIKSLITLATLSLSPLSAAERVIESNSLNSCSKGSLFTASLFNVAFTPNNNSLAININGVSSISGNVTAQLQAIAYGFTILNQTLDPCTMDLSGFCPMQSGNQLNIQANIAVSNEVKNRLPGVAYTVPDLDGVVRVYVNRLDTGEEIACLEADLSNTKTVYQPAVGWALAIIAGLALIASGITSGLGHTNTAAHVAANAIALFGYFQAQAIVGMTSVKMPPIVQSWTQNFAWSMGIIRVGFLQSIATWYQRSTGGTPTTYLSTLSTYSVQVEKRFAHRLLTRSAHILNWAATEGARALTKRQSNGSSSSNDNKVGQVKVVRGIDRVGFRARIEQTNIFMTGLIFFVGILVIVAILVALAKAALDAAAKAGWMKGEKFAEFRNGWKIVIKGILFRLILLGFVQMSILCLWELVERDSAAEVILALVVFISMATALGFASYKVVMLAKKSIDMHKNPAYILYSSPECLNKWGFLYIQYKATSYYFIIPVLGYILFKAVFIAFAQSSPVAQAVGILVIEAAALIAVSILRPFMDKKANIFNISILAVGFLNAVFLLIFSDAFGQPEYVSSVMGVIFAFYNLIFTFVLVVMVFVSSIYAVCSKNPETRYQPMRDDRGSFIKSQQQLTTELDALGATARGDGKAPYGQAKVLDDDESLSTDSLNKQPTEVTNEKYQPMSNQRGYSYSQENTDPYQNQVQQHYGQQQTYDQGYNHGGYNYGRPGTAPQQPSYDRSASDYSRPPRSAHGGYGPQQYRQQNNASPWQRGAGYD